MKNIRSETPRVEPEYFDYFLCKCGACRNCCCGGWKIGVSMREYFKLIGMRCSKELHRRIEVAFAVPDEPSLTCYRYIAPDYKGSCHLLGDDGLCLLQKECGVSVLPEVCRLYPRSFMTRKNKQFACCTASCEGVVEMLMRCEPLDFFYYENPRGRAKRVTAADLQTDEAGIHAAYYIRNRRLPLSLRLLLVCKLLRNEPYTEPGDEALPDALNRLLCIMQELCAGSASLVPYAEKLSTLLNQPRDPVKAFCRDRAVFEASYPLWENYFENILQNHMFYVNFPEVDSRLKSVDAAHGLCLAYAIMRVACILGTAESSSEELFADIIAAVFHLTEHTAFYYNARILVGDFIPLLVI